MRWLIGIFIVLDIIYQLFGDCNDFRWSIYYNMTHYVFISAVCLYYIHDKMINYFSIYFLAVTFTIAYQGINSIPLTSENSLYIWGYIILTLLLIFSIRKIWKR